MEIGKPGLTHRGRYGSSARVNQTHFLWFAAYFLLAFIAFSITDKSQALHWLLYGVPLLLLAITIGSQRDQTIASLLLLPGLFIGLYIVSSMFSDIGVSTYSSTRALGAYGLFFIICGFRLRVTDRLAIGFCISLLPVGISMRFITGRASSELFDLGDSESSTESVFAIVFAISAIVFAVKRRPVFAILCVVLCVVGFKRNAWIGLGAVIAVALTYGMLRPRLAFHTRRILDIGVLSTIFVGMFLFSFAVMPFFLWLQSNIFPSQRIDHLTVGRSDIWTILDVLIGQMSWKDIILGYGPGRVADVLTSHVPLSGGLAHNEYKSLFLDFGICGILLYFLFVVVSYLRNSGAFYVCIYIVVTSEVENFFYVFVVSMPAIIIVNGLLRGD